MPARFNRRLGLALVGALALVIATASPGAATPGDPDPTFDGDGRVTTDFFGTEDGANGVAIQGDGKIVAAGFAVVSGSGDFALTRYHANGTLDTTFDGDGKVTTDFVGLDDRAFAVAIQGDGKIVAAGFADVSVTSFDFALARYNANGSLDTTFDGDGKVTTDFPLGTVDEARAVAIQGDGKIVAAGSTDVPGLDFALARYNSDGSLDTTFDTDGLVTTNFVGSDDEAFAVAVQGDGKIVAVGYASDFDDDFALARYNTDGSLDTTFDGDGLVTTDFANDFDQALAVALQGDGKIVAAGFAIVPGLDFALARYNTDGSLDTTFDGDGKLTTDFAGNADLALAVAVQVNGKIVAAGESSDSSSFRELFALVRYNPNGSLDTAFSEDGRVVTDFAGSRDSAHAVAIQTDRKIVAAGCTGCFSGASDFALARYAGDSCRRTSRPTSIPCPS